MALPSHIVSTTHAFVVTHADRPPIRYQFGLMATGINPVCLTTTFCCQENSAPSIADLSPMGVLLVWTVRLHVSECCAG